jgi:hypothetical protein
MKTGRNPLTQPRQKAIGYGLIGMILILVGIKLALNTSLLRGTPLKQSGLPAVLFFNIADPCDCIRDLVSQAEAQIADWQPHNGNISLVRLNIGANLDLEAKYDVFRAPALILLDASGQIAWRQDYPLIEGGPFKLDELEAVITSFDDNGNAP